MVPDAQGNNMIPGYKTYLQGYVIGYSLAGSEALLEKPKFYPEGTTAFLEPVVFKTREAAEKKARKEYAGRLNGKYIRDYTYSTPNPKNAKGLKLIEDCTPEERAKVYIEEN